MRILLDNNVPRTVRRLLPGYEVLTARELGWDTLSNGRLLSAAEQSAFSVIVTADRNIQYQQNRAKLLLAFVVLSTNNRSRLMSHGELIVAAIARATPASFEVVAIPLTPK